jgi:hypothetical protein
LADQHNPGRAPASYSDARLSGALFGDAVDKTESVVEIKVNPKM